MPRHHSANGVSSANARPTIFIASSREVERRGILDEIVTGLGNRFRPVPWNTAFGDESETTLQTLLRMAGEVDGAILVCAHDDVANKRGTVSPVARDNINIEYGFFLATLGLQRVSVLWEEGVDTPSDVSELNRRYFRSDGQRSTVHNDPVLQSSLRQCVKLIGERWKDLSPRPRPGPRSFHDRGMAVAGTLAFADRRITEIAAQLDAFAEKGAATSDVPIRFDSRRMCLLAYAEGLQAVRRRFWTTSFLTSGFWAGQDLDVMDANRVMLRRVLPGGTVRRLFLLDAPPRNEINQRKRRMVHLRQAGASAEVEAMWSVLQNHKENFQQLINLGCEVRVAHDPRGALAGKLPAQLHVEPQDTEIALYDEFRLDIFGGGRQGAISSVDVFSRAYRRFDTVQDEVEKYFVRLWEGSQSGIDFLLALEEAYQAAEKRIDYTSNWLALFEYALDHDDQDLKTVEINRVVEVLRGHGRLGTLSRYLDIGTATGRYPRGLRDYVQPNGMILGIDADPDCVRFAQGHPELAASPDPRISYLLMDFTMDEHQLGEFDLITCMLSTLSHFGTDRNPGFDDTLQRALNRVRSLLRPDGLFIFSLYSEEACDALDLLKIYQRHDMERLVTWTPPGAEVRRRLEMAGLRLLEQPRPGLARLDLYVCTPIV
jgi:SAM-dependent methyltransferase